MREKNSTFEKLFIITHLFFIPLSDIIFFLMITMNVTKDNLNKNNTPKIFDLIISFKLSVIQKSSMIIHSLSFY